MKTQEKKALKVEDIIFESKSVLFQITKKKEKIAPKFENTNFSPKILTN